MFLYKVSFVILLSLCYLLYSFNISITYAIILSGILFIYLYIEYIYCKTYYSKVIKEPLYKPILLQSDQTIPLVPGTIISFSTFITSIIPTVRLKQRPKIMFRMSWQKYDQLPIEISTSLQETATICPDYVQVYLCSHTDIYDFVYTYYPQYLSCVQSIIPGAFKSDLVRLLLLYHYGGIYNDIGHTYIKSISSWIAPDDTLVLVRDTQLVSFIDTPFTSYGILNCFIASYPRHPIIGKFIKGVMKNVSEKKYGIIPIDSTGPKALGRIYNKCQGIYEHTSLPIGFTSIIYHSISYPVFFLDSILGKYGSNKNTLIIDDVIRTKFLHYKNVMYKKNNIPAYSRLWFHGLLYRNI